MDQLDVLMPIRSSEELCVQSSVVREHAGPRITLTWCHGAASVELDGFILEAQFACGDRHLVFTTEDVPYEESLHIHLLDAQLQVLDHLELSAPYSPGLLEKLAIAGPQELRFAFFDREEVWSLTVLDSARWQFGFGPHPIKRHGSFWRKCWLQLQRRKGG